jgi:hypothetical protein
MIKAARLAAIAAILLSGYQNCSPTHVEGLSSLSQAGGGTTYNPAAFQALQTEALAILDRRCTGCHTGLAGGNLPDVTNIEGLKSSDYIVPGQPQNSPLYLAIIDGVMPENGPNLVNSYPAEVFTLRDWIQMMR